jgi:hypothetical protein
MTENAHAHRSSGAYSRHIQRELEHIMPAGAPPLLLFRVLARDERIGSEADFLNGAFRIPRAPISSARATRTNL